MLETEISPFVCEQFVWGKILHEGKDISGYKKVAQSSGLSEKDCAEVLARTGAGVSHAILRGRSAYAFFPFSANRMVFSCTQRSPKPENNSRYYLQSHFLIADWEALENIDFDLVFLAKQIGEIPRFEQVLTLNLVKENYARGEPIETKLRRIISSFPDDFMLNAYRAFKGDYPVAIFDASKDEYKVLQFFQLLIFLTPPLERKLLNFASMTSGTETTSFKFKVNPTGILKTPHLIVRLDDAKVVPAALVDQMPYIETRRFWDNLQNLRQPN